MSMTDEMKIAKSTKCKHFAVGRISQKDIIIRLPVLPEYCENVARIYYVGVGKTPQAEVDKILACFKKFKYCLKCGQKIF